MYQRSWLLVGATMICFGQSQRKKSCECPSVSVWLSVCVWARSVNRSCLSDLPCPLSVSPSRARPFSACLRSISLSKQDDLCLCIESNRDNKIFADALERCTHILSYGKDRIRDRRGMRNGRTHLDVDVCSINGSCIRCHRLVATFNDCSN